MNTTVQARVNINLKQEADLLFKNLGISTSDAIRLFLQQAINRNSIPFEIKAKEPSKDTLLAIMELREGQGESFSNVEELFKSWDN